ncbi:MAG: lipase/acyltransferase domain-containing protein [Mycobacterium leprae]
MALDSKWHVIIVPGLFATVLEKRGRRIWPLPFRPDEMKYDPALPDDGVVPVKVIKWAMHDLYCGLERFLRRFATVDYCPFDWRRPVEDEAVRVSDLVRTAPADAQIALVGHSLGGLVAKRSLLQDPTVHERVRYFFSLGTPWLGAPVAFDELHNNMRILGIPFPTAVAGRTMPAGYEVLPSRLYFQERTYLQRDGVDLSYEESVEAADEASPGSYYTRYNEGQLQHWVYQPFGPDLTHCIVAGTGERTGIRIQVEGNKVRIVGWERTGDGTVPGISQAWHASGATVRYLHESHVSLAAAKPVWRWIRHTLLTGKPDEFEEGGLRRMSLVDLGGTRQPA